MELQILKHETKKTNGRVFWILTLLLSIQLITVLAFTVQKKGYFIDELYSFGLSNSYYQPFVVSPDSYNATPSSPSSSDIFDRWVDSKPFHEYMTVQKGEAFTFGSVYYNQTQDVHPPLYYMLLHALCSFFPDTYSKWLGIAINLLPFVLCGFFVFLIARELLDSPWAALLPVAFWGSSAGGISTVIYIRMYMLLTLFAVISIYLHLRMVRYGQNRKRLMLIYLVTLAGLLTQYYFVILAFFLSAVYCLYQLAKHRFKESSVYAAVMFGAVGSMIAIFPACITHLTREDEFVAEATRNNMFRLETLKNNLISYISNLNIDFFGKALKPILVVFAALMLLCLLFTFLRYRQNKTLSFSLSFGDKMAFSLLLIIGLTIFTIAGVAVVPSSRYIYYVYPFLSILLVWCILFFCRLSFVTTNHISLISMLLITLISAHSYRNGCVQYLYPEEPARMATAKSYHDLYCLYFDDYRNAPLTQDVTQLPLYKGVYITPKESISNLDTILYGKDISKGMIVYIDTNAFWSSGYHAEEILSKLTQGAPFHSYQKLFTQELSETYLLLP